jgi:hypothetical protein
MSTLVRLLLGHLIGDFCLQTIGLVNYKAHSWKGLFLHAGIVLASSALCLWDELLRWWPWLLPLFVWHVFTDWLKVTMSRRFPERRLAPFAFDQAMHIGAIVAVICIGQGGWPYPDVAAVIGGGSLAANRNILFLAAFLIALFVVPLLEVQVAFKLTRTFVNGQAAGNGPGASLADRLWGGGERTVALGLLYLWLSAIAVWNRAGAAVAAGPELWLYSWLNGIAVWAVWLTPLAFLPRILAFWPAMRRPGPGRLYWFKIATSIVCTAVLGAALWVVIALFLSA